MRLTLLALAGATLLAMPAAAFADEAVVVHGAAPPPGQTVVTEPAQPEAQVTEPCRSRTTTTTNNDTGATHTKQTTNCPD